ncbi:MULTISPECIES: NAD(P)/FAD-dependent oxidoreductase [Dyadobacter]|uniref:NADH:ubiquinone reductase (non-electrogenic) n=1 Tax=Dyadobacter chenhuakuii TaxID=2909339 RepID=A0A9X1QAA6_9BACT|nr:MULTISPECIES: NAD(P)/FAD-dependent oxidoreductase [Dyadobacter]MCE7072054.1 NAD(P)/FAD-dependent oxidoreductase [Dyadobacter sp. CY327]MCF2498045.1 NAD(P)/FAD-dependent oxidoreductase [Dyadobacter chenhuakuii]MCF2518954.1 NAD(P)/FAD-dependent oxidoreductase [Dyadobacter sp. CY351]
MLPNIPYTQYKRVVIVGAGFGGLALAREIAKREDLQVVLIDRNNYHQFQPLFYQVAMAGLEPSSISFPLRKIFQSKKNVHIRITEVQSVNTDRKSIMTGLGEITYDYLVIATGAITNYFGMKEIEERAIPMKTVSEALALRNRILQNFEDALSVDSDEQRAGLMSVVVVGGGPTGVELSGTLAEMKHFILPKDYPEMDFKSMEIHLLEGSKELLGAMSDESSQRSREYLEKMGVHIHTEQVVTGFDGKYVTTKQGMRIRADNLVWAAGIKANPLNGLNPEVIVRGGRIKVDQYNRVEGYDNVFALGDVAAMQEGEWENGHPQLAQPAIQQGKALAKNVWRVMDGKKAVPFKYKDLGSMATVGRNRAVVDLPFIKFQGFLAWLTWMFVHLISIVGVKNRLLILINWVWNYATYDQSLRLILKPKTIEQISNKNEKNEEAVKQEAQHSHS